MSLASIADALSIDDAFLSSEMLHDLAKRNNFEIALQDEPAYLLGLKSSYAIAQQVENLPNYIDPRLSPLRTQEVSRTSRRPKSHENGLNGWCHTFKLQASEPTSQILGGRTVAVKDTIAVGQIPQTLGTLPRLLSRSAIYPNSSIDATVVRRLLQAGAILQGTSICENFSLSPLSCTSIFGAVRNPWDRTFTTGGSSSGSAALVALAVARRAGETGLESLGPDVEMALGGDQAGSIRVPASHCGIFGLKPTFGLIPYTGIAGLLPMIDHVGPLTANLEDMAMLLTSLAGYDGLDARMSPESPLRDHVLNYFDELQDFVQQVKHTRTNSDKRTSKSPLRVGLIAESFQIPGMSVEVADVVRSAAYAAFEAISAEISEVAIPMHLIGPVIWTAAVRNQMASQAFGGRAPDMLTHNLPHLDLRWPATQDHCDVGSTHNPAVTLTILGETMLQDQMPMSAQTKAHRHILQLQAAYDAALESYDVLITPTSPTVAPKIPESHTKSDGLSHAEKIIRLAAGSTNNTSPFNVTGHPALSVPCGWASSTSTGCRLPVGMQIIGKRFDDLGVLKAAKLFEIGGGKLGPRPN